MFAEEIIETYGKELETLGISEDFIFSLNGIEIEIIILILETHKKSNEYMTEIEDLKSSIRDLQNDVDDLRLKV